MERGAGFSAITQNPEFMAAIGKSFTSQTATLSRMVEERDDNGIFRNEIYNIITLGCDTSIN